MGKMVGGFTVVLGAGGEFEDEGIFWSSGTPPGAVTFGDDPSAPPATLASTESCTYSSARPLAFASFFILMDGLVLLLLLLRVWRDRSMASSKATYC